MPNFIAEDLKICWVKFSIFNHCFSFLFGDKLISAALVKDLRSLLLKTACTNFDLTSTLLAHQPSPTSKDCVPSLLFRERMLGAVNVLLELTRSILLYCLIITGCWRLFSILVCDHGISGMRFHEHGSYSTGDILPKLDHTFDTCNVMLTLHILLSRSFSIGVAIHISSWMFW